MLSDSQRTFTLGVQQISHSLAVDLHKGHLNAHITFSYCDIIYIGCIYCSQISASAVKNPYRDVRSVKQHLYGVGQLRVGVLTGAFEQIFTHLQRDGHMIINPLGSEDFGAWRSLDMP